MSASQLSRREIQVRDMVIAGHANKVIAQVLRISQKTVETHRARVIHKYNVRSTVELVKKCLLGETQLARLAFSIADEAAETAIRSFCPLVEERYFDIGAATDDVQREAKYLVERGLAQVFPTDPNLLLLRT